MHESRAHAIDDEYMVAWAAIADGVGHGKYMVISAGMNGMQVLRYIIFPAGIVAYYLASRCCISYDSCLIPGRSMINIPFQIYAVYYM